jgi:peptidoglycan-associated lipoprotein
MNRVWVRFAWIVMLASAVAVSGCKGSRFRRGGSSGTDNNLAGVQGTGVEAGELGMGDERLEGTAVAGQFTPVYFDYDSAQVKPSERPAIEAAAEYLRKNASLAVVVEGHCDERGSAEYNLALGERRALAVRAYLVGLGVDAARVQTRSFGEERPADPGHEDAAWSRNRRGEFVLMK